MSTCLRSAVLALLAIASFVGPANALPANIGRGVGAALPMARPLADGGIVAAPRAFQSFCDAYADQCVTSNLSMLPELTVERWEQLNGVNAAVNAQIRPRPDEPGNDIWTIGATEGDCDDYAAEKRRELLDLGWPSSALALTVVFIRTGEPHLVLTVRTDRGDLVLDNMRGRILPVERTGYRFVARQSTIHPRLWVKIDGMARELVATAKTRPSTRPAVSPAVAETATASAVLSAPSAQARPDAAVVPTAAEAPTAEAEAPAGLVETAARLEVGES